MQTRVLVLGASYGSLLATKLLMAGHAATLVCTAPTAALIERAGTRVRFPLAGRADTVEVDSRSLPGTLAAAVPGDVDPAAFDLVVLAMQEAQYGASGVRELMARIARAGNPCLAIMNMPPLAWLAHLPGVETSALRHCYAHPEVWDAFDPRNVTLASPDPQAFRPADAPKNVLEVGLPTNFKAAAFRDPVATALLHRLARDIEAARLPSAEGPLAIPVKLKVHESRCIPLAKWPMLLAGNYRCVRADGAVSIRDAVHGDLEASRRMYAWVCDLCTALGAGPGDLVPFDVYARAAEKLGQPSSAARALAAGAHQIERVDRLVQGIAGQRALRSEVVDRIVARVDRRLAANRVPRAPAAAPRRLAQPA